MGAKSCSEDLLSCFFCLCAIKPHNSSDDDDKAKAAIFASKGAAFATLFFPDLSSTGLVSGSSIGTGFLIHRNLLLTTHSNVPSVPVAESVVARIGLGRAPARLAPHRFFITSSTLDLTIISIEQADSNSSQPQPQSQPQFLKITCTQPILNHNSTVYLIGHTSDLHLSVGTGKVIISTDDLIKISASGSGLPPGSAGFDCHGNLAFVLCDPMKLTSKELELESEWGSDRLQFGIPIAVVCNWLYQNWEGSLDEVTRPSRLGHSCTSFSLRNINLFRHGGTENDAFSPNSPSEMSSYWNFSSGLAHDNPVLDFRLSAQENGVERELAPEMYETYDSPGTNCGGASRNPEAVFPKTIFLPLPLKQLFSEEISRFHNSSYAERNDNNNNDDDNDNNTCRSVSSYESSCNLDEELQEKKMTSEEEEDTMYSAETMESRNVSCRKVNSVPVPVQLKVGRSQSCVTYQRCISPSTGTGNYNSAGTRTRRSLRNHQSAMPVRNSGSQNTAFRTGHDYLCPTVSSSLKRRNSAEEMMRHNQNQNSVRVSPRWVF